MANLIERHQRDIRGVLSCLDRVVIQGTIPSICHPKAMATMLDLITRVQRGELPPPPVAALVGFGIVSIEPGRVVIRTAPRAGAVGP